MTLTHDVPTQSTRDAADQSQAAERPTLLPPATGAALTEALDGSFHAQKQRWREEIVADDIVRDPSLDMAAARAWTLDRVVRLSERDFVTAGFPTEQGGTGDQSMSVANFEMAALGDLSLTIKTGVQHGLFGGAIVNLGTKEQHERFLPDVVKAKLLGCFAMTELGHGSDVNSIETTITWLPDTHEFEVNSPTPGSRKAYIGNAGQDGTMAAVFGQLWVDGDCKGVHTILVPIRDDQGNDLPGVTTSDHGHKGGLLGVDNGMIMFDHVRVPRDMLLSRYGGVNEDGEYVSPIESVNARFFTMLGTLVRGRICVGGGAASSARRALSVATRYALKRSQFRKPGLGEEVLLMDYQTHQRRLLPHIARAYAYGFAQNELAEELQRVIDLNDSNQRDDVRSRQLETRAAGMKAVLTHWATEAIQECREACGGAGFMSENQIALCRADVDVFNTFEGDNTVLLQLVAKALLLDYRKSWGDMDMRGTAQATARMVGASVMERTTARSAINRIVDAGRRVPDSQKLLSRGWQVEMFEDRERHLVETLAQRMRAAGKLPKEESFAATNAVQSHMLAAARAHTERMVLEAFIAGIEKCKDEAAASLLSQLCDLYALSSLEADRGWLLEHDRITASRSKAITATVDELCAALRPHALELVEGLGIPEEWLQAPCLTDVAMLGDRA